MRLIDADALTNAHIDCPEHISFFDFGEIVELFLKTVDKQPTVEIIHCKDCKHFYEDGGNCTIDLDWIFGLTGNDYCSRAERKETKDGHH